MTHFSNIQSSVSKEVLRAGRKPEEVKLIAVSKTVGIQEVADAIAQGATDFGENRPEKLVEKATAYPQVNWHFIGNIQSRRIPEIVAHACLIHSVFDEHHLQKINSAAKRLDKVQDILIEVNVSGEQSKSGVTPKDAAQLVLQGLELDNVRVCGLMTMAPQGNEQLINSTFNGLALLKEEISGLLFQENPEKASVFSELSMGMSEDWPYAVMHGATMVRIGRAIFSDQL